MQLGGRPAVSEHSSALAHHFDDLEQQHESVTLGMWVFLVTEVMFFGGLFAGYAIYRTAYPDAWREASHHLDLAIGAANTTVLIGSSLTMAFAVHAAQVGKKVQLCVNLILTMLLGAVFLGVKVVEYADKFHHGLVPGSLFTFDAGALTQQVQLFFVFYFAMTGMHALHMVIGFFLMIYLLVKALRGGLLGDFYKPVEVVGLYWHFVDIVWIFLFPLLYLIGRHHG